MSLRSLGNALLIAGDRLLAACCDICFPPPAWCNTSKDNCGNDIKSCGPQGPSTTGPCTPDCVSPTEPCECGPEAPCPLCYECVDRKCVRLPDCCADGQPCPPCQQCVNGVCKPCDPCSKCVNGECVPCGPCEKCDQLGQCVPCSASELCINGVCVPKQYYCCYDSPPPPPPATRTTSCRAAAVTPVGQQNPCEHGAKSGPHNSLLACEQMCSRYKCAPNACGNNQCVPDPDGPYQSFEACNAACEDPCDMPCAFAGGNAPGVYSIDGCEREICVSYTSLNSRPIRVQIWGPTMADGCPVPGTRVIKTDSAWRCSECCDCPNVSPRSNDPRECQGGPKGEITWSKPRGVTSFEVAVLTACGAEYAIDIQACGPCTPQADPVPCACDANDDCKAGCRCVDGKCKPCLPPISVTCSEGCPEGYDCCYKDNPLSPCEPAPLTNFCLFVIGNPCAFAPPIGATDAPAPGDLECPEGFTKFFDGSVTHCTKCLPCPGGFTRPGAGGGGAWGPCDCGGDCYKSVPTTRPCANPFDGGACEGGPTVFIPEYGATIPLTACQCGGTPPCPANPLP